MVDTNQKSEETIQRQSHSATVGALVQKRYLEQEGKKYVGGRDGELIDSVCQCELILHVFSSSQT